MKKLLLIAVLFCLTGCIRSHHEGNNGGSMSTIIEFGYRGHDYIYFSYFGDESGTVIHNPDCHCFKDSVK